MRFQKNDLYNVTLCKEEVELDSKKNWGKKLNASKILINQVRNTTDRFDLLKAICNVITLKKGGVEDKQIFQQREIEKNIIISIIGGKKPLPNQRITLHHPPKIRANVVFLNEDLFDLFMEKSDNNIFGIRDKAGFYNVTWDLHGDYVDKLVKEQDEVTVKFKNLNCNVVGEVTEKLNSLGLKNFKLTRKIYQYQSKIDGNAKHLSPSKAVFLKFSLQENVLQESFGSVESWKNYISDTVEQK
eukprot:Pgem_evm1s9141